MKEMKKNTVVYNEYEGGQYFGERNNPYHTLIKGTSNGIIHPQTEIIGLRAFSGVNGLEKIRIPESVRKIDGAAFLGAPDLAEVLLPDSVEEIGLFAFKDCRKLRRVCFGEGLQEIQADAFCHCTDLESIEDLPPETRLGSGAFYDCPKLQDETGVVIINGVLCQDFRMQEDVVIPEGVWRIDGCAYGDSVGELQGYRKIVYDHYFEQRKKIRSVTSSSGVREIGVYAFAKCDNLMEINWQEGIEKIGCGAFQGCPRLKTVELPHSVKLIEVYAFANCKDLERIVLHGNIQFMHPCALEGSNNLREIIVPKTIKRIPGFKLQSYGMRRKPVWLKKAIKEEKTDYTRLGSLIKRSGED